MIDVAIIGQNATNISRAGEQITVGVKRIAEATRELSGLADELEGAIGAFRVA